MSRVFVTVEIDDDERTGLATGLYRAVVWQDRTLQRVVWVGLNSDFNILADCLRRHAPNADFVYVVNVSTMPELLTSDVLSVAEMLEIAAEYLKAEVAA